MAAEAVREYSRRPPDDAVLDARCSRTRATCRGAFDDPTRLRRARSRAIDDFDEDAGRAR